MRRESNSDGSGALRMIGVCRDPPEVCVSIALSAIFTSRLVGALMVTNAFIASQGKDSASI